MNLRDVAADLYGVAPAEFVSARAAAASGADRELRADIKALRKPTASAAAVNALTRRDPALIDRLLALGDRMRDAFAARDRDAIREVTRQRQRLLQTALRDLDASPSVAREVEETLQAAVIDPAAAAAVRSGMLVRALESTGVESVDVSEAVAVPLDESELAARSLPAVDAVPRGADSQSAKSEPGPGEPGESASDRRERQRAIRAAERALERARSEADALDDELDEEVDRRADLEAERADLDRRLQRTEAELSESKAAERQLRKRIPELQRAVRDAERALDEARGG